MPEGPKPLPTPPNTPVGVAENGVLLVGFTPLVGLVVDGLVVVDGFVVVIGVPAALNQQKKSESHQTITEN